MSRRFKISQRQSYAIGLAVLVLLFVVVGSGVFYSAYLPGGTGWQLDYQWVGVRINGGIASQTFDEYTADTSTAGTWVCDPDGQPDENNDWYNPNQAGAAVTVSLVGRVDVFGTPLMSWDAIDPLQEIEEVEYVEDGVDMIKKIYKYYYAWEVKIESEQQMYHVQSPAALCGVVQREEAGEVDVTATLGLIAERSVFGNVSAYFMDCHVDRVTYTPTIEAIEDDLASYIWAQEPNVYPYQSEGARIDIENVEMYEDLSLAQITVGAKITPGVIATPITGTCASLDYNHDDYKVALEMRLILTVLQEQPFVLGHETDIDTPAPPKPPEPPTPWEVLAPYILIIAMIMVIIIVIVIVYAYVRYRMARTTAEIGMAAVRGY